MSIDIASETIIPINRAHEHIPGRPHKSTVWRWTQRGVRGHRLETIVAGGRRYTSVQAVQRFCDVLTSESPAPAIPPARRDAHLAAAEAYLDASGIN